MVVEAVAKYLVFTHVSSFPAKLMICTTVEIMRLRYGSASGTSSLMMFMTFASGRLPSNPFARVSSLMLAPKYQKLILLAT